MFKAFKREGYIVKELDLYLMNKQEDSGRAVNVNAPSQAGNCLRSNYYMRMQCENDGSIDARTMRIFNNGTGVHERLQAYLLDMGLLLMDEVPLRNDEYNIQGSTDGFLKIDSNEIGILEIKSINNGGFTALKDAKDEHKIQGMVYLYCSEERRKFLQKKYKSLKELVDSKKDRIKYFESLYPHVKDGSKHTRKEKLKHLVDLNLLADEILFNTKRPITKVIFLYENKDNQELKEFCVERDESIISSILKDYELLNECIEDEMIPKRYGENKSSSTCRYCGYKLNCWN